MVSGGEEWLLSILQHCGLACGCSSLLLPSPCDGTTIVLAIHPCLCLWGWFGRAPRRGSSLRSLQGWGGGVAAAMASASVLRYSAVVTPSEPELTRIHQSAFWRRHSSTYTQLEVLGKGGFGTAFKVCHADGSVRALKLVVLRDTSDSEEELQSLKLEAEILKTLRHPHILGFHQAWTTRFPCNMLVFAMDTEFCQRGTCT